MAAHIEEGVYLFAVAHYDDALVAYFPDKKVTGAWNLTCVARVQPLAGEEPPHLMIKPLRGYVIIPRETYKYIRGVERRWQIQHGKPLRGQTLTPRRLWRRHTLLELHAKRSLSLPITNL